MSDKPIVQTQIPDLVANPVKEDELEMLADFDAFYTEMRNKFVEARKSAVTTT